MAPAVRRARRGPARRPCAVPPFSRRLRFRGGGLCWFRLPRRVLRVGRRDPSSGSRCRCAAAAEASWSRWRGRRTVDREVPKGLQIHLILDNYSTHKHANVQQWLAKHPRQPAFDKPPTPYPHRLRPDTGLSGNLLIGFACRATQHDPTPLCQRLRRRRPTRPPLQRLALVLGQHQLGLRPAPVRHGPGLQLSIKFLAQDTRTNVVDRSHTPGIYWKRLAEERGTTL